MNTYPEWARRQLTAVHTIVWTGFIKDEMNKSNPDLAQVREDLEMLEFMLMIAADGSDEDVTSYVNDVFDDSPEVWKAEMNETASSEDTHLGLPYSGDPPTVTIVER